MEPTRTSMLPVHNGPLAVNTNVSSTAFLDRIRNNPRLALQLSIAVVVLIVLGAGITLYTQHREAQAAEGLAAAMDIYDTPISTPDQPLPPGTRSFPTLEARAKAANAQFAAVANQYGSTTSGRNAQYLQGVTAMQSGDNATAETLLKKAADDWNHDIATLAQMSLAGLYRSTNREAQAAELYKKVADKPSILVPAGLAQISLAEMYEAQGKTADARKLYASVKDKDPKSASADIATQKLAGAPAAR